MACSNCELPADPDTLCGPCQKEVARAPKMADDINNKMEAAGIPIRWDEQAIREALLLNRKREVLGRK